MKRYASKSAILAVFLALGCCFGPIGAAAQNSEAYLVIDTRTGKVLVGDNFNDKLPVASLTKIATACVVLDWLTATDGDRNAYISVPNSVREIGGANPLNLQPGDRISMRNSLSSMMMASDNRAAEALAAFESAQAAAAPVLDMAGLATDPPVIARGTLTEIDGVTQQGLIATLSRTPGQLRWAGRALGADDDSKPGSDGDWLA